VLACEGYLLTKQRMRYIRNHNHYDTQNDLLETQTVDMLQGCDTKLGRASWHVFLVHNAISLAR